MIETAAMNPTAAKTETEVPAETPRPMSAEAIALEVADVLNTTLELDAVLARVAEVVRRAIDYEIFAILLLNEKTQEMRMRFQIGHDPALAERIRVKVGKGITGRAACASTTSPRTPLTSTPIRRCVPNSPSR
jgi:transcriptional regulator with GAF, ATPase, and Fis domain